MSTEISSLHVSLSADIADLKRGLAQSTKLLEGVANDMKRVGQNAQKVTGDTGKLGNALKSVGDIGKIAIGNVLASAFTSAINGMRGLLGEALDSVAGYEQLTMSIENLVARELRATDATLSMEQALAAAKAPASDLLGWIQKIAIESPFEQQDVADAFKMALSYGFTAEEAQRLTSALIDQTAAMGMSGEAMAGIGLALGQIKAKGKVTAEELNQLRERGVDVNSVLAEMGFTLDDVTKGLVNADSFIENTTRMLEEDFQGAAKRTTETWGGLISTLSDIKSVGLREFFQGTLDALQPLAAEVVNFLSDPATMERLREYGEIFGGKVATGVQLARDAIQTFQQAWSGDWVDSDVIHPTARLVGIIASLGQYFLTAVRDGEPFNDFLRQLPEGMQPIVQKIGELVVWLRENLPKAITTAMAIWEERIVPTFHKTKDFVETSLIPNFVKIRDWLAENLPTAIQRVSDFWTNTLQPALVTVRDFIATSVVPTLATIRDWLATNLPGAIQTVSDFWTGVLQPALQAVGAFIRDTLIPTIQNVAATVLPALDTAVETVAGIWRDVLLPAFEIVWDFTENSLIPLIDKLAELLEVTLKLAVEVAAGAWENILQPALEGVWDFIQNTLLPIFEPLREWLEDKIPAGAGTAQGAIDNFRGAIDAIAGAISTVIGWIDTLISKLESIEVPSILQQHSPSELEQSFLSVGEAVAFATRMIDGLKGVIGQAGHWLDKAGAFGGIAGFFGNTLLDKTAGDIEALAAEIEGMFPFLDLGDDPLAALEEYIAEVYRSGSTVPEELLRKQERLAELERQRTEQQEKLAKLEKQRIDLQILQQQLGLAEMLKEHGLSLDLLKGIAGFGTTGVDMMAMLDVMTIAMQQAIEQVGIPGFARGGSFTVPPGHPNDSYLIGLTSGERVSVSPAGQSGGVVQNVTQNFYIQRVDGVQELAFLRARAA